MATPKIACVPNGPYLLESAQLRRASGETWPTGKGVALETLEIVHEGFLDD